MGAEIGREGLISTLAAATGVGEANGSQEDEKPGEWFEDKEALENVGSAAVDCIKALRSEVDTPFEPTSNKEHERLLEDIWVAFTGDKSSFKVKTKLWKEFGFQCDEPWTDVRGGGKLSMENLKYFLTHYRDSAISLMKRQKNIMQLRWRENWYPFSTVGVNVTDLVCRVIGVYRREFNVSRRGSSRRTGYKPWVLWRSMVDEEIRRGSEVETRLNVFGEPSPNSAPRPPKWQWGFSEIYCVAFMLLDRNFVECNASYFDFSQVLLKTEEELADALHKTVGKSLQLIKPYLSIYPRSVAPPLPPGPPPVHVIERARDLRKSIPQKFKTTTSMITKSSRKIFNKRLQADAKITPPRGARTVTKSNESKKRELLNALLAPPSPDASGDSFRSKGTNPMTVSSSSIDNQVNKPELTGWSVVGNVSPRSELGIGSNKEYLTTEDMLM